MTEQASGLNVLTLSPLEIHFSQTRIRYEFQDGRSLQTALEGVEEKDIHFDGEEAVLLLPPFPRIEVTRWRCKLRDEDGAAKVDENGLELYSQEERWFSFDNRRLWCLQRAAARRWPKKVYCEVFEISPTLAKTRELRKFDTRTCGRSVLIGRREEENLEKWCWRTEVGLAVDSPEAGVALPALRHRRPDTERRGSESRKRNQPRRPSKDDNEEPERQPANEILQGFLVFMIIYLSLRVCVILFRKYS